MFRNNVAWVNNNLTSTPLYNGNWCKIDILKLAQKIEGHYPKSIIIFRSLEPKTEPRLFNKFDRIDFIPLLGRQVYIFDPKTSNYKRKRSFQMDKKLCKEQTCYYWTLLDLNNESEIDRVLSLYTKLYIEKHSVYNPMYTRKFVKDGFGKFKLRFEVLKDKKDHKIVAEQGIQETERVINTCFIGYDQTLPIKIGLYRMMNFELMTQAIKKNKVLNMSSGAGDFKTKRGAVPSFEYQMIYKKNLSGLHRKIWEYIVHLLELKVKRQMETLKV